jgi:peptidoglycan/LPS O-acetylase OafA/YrhL
MTMPSGNELVERESPGTAGAQPETELATAHASFLGCKYFSSLDVFRFLAIVAVVWHHTVDGVAWLPASSRGFLGVDFFFVISGFLIVTLLLRERARNGSISLRQFYLRRSLRIFPIYYGLIGVVSAFVLVKPGAGIARNFWETWPFQVFYLSNFIDASGLILFFTWSLSTEEQFYLIWPPVERWSRRFAIPILVGVIVVNQLVNFRLLDRLLGDWKYLSIAQITFTPICLGVLLAHLLHDRRWFGRLAGLFGGRWASMALLLALFLACNLPNPDLSGWPRLLIQVLMTLLLTSCVIREDSELNRLLGFRIIRRIGVISYGMYLYHMFTIHAAKVALDRAHVKFPAALFVLGLLLTIVSAELSYRFYEMPFLRLKDRLGHSSRASTGKPS